ncbi:MAG: dihydrolipoyl dehydrogenase [Paenibacillaceae bacterium]
MSKQYQIVILGGGVGGYTAAIRAAQLGKTVALVERDKLGGTCLHSGCIPSKSLLRSAEVYTTMKDSEAYGIETTGVTLNFDRVQERKRKIVEQLHKGVEFLMKKNKIDIYHGNGRVIGPSIFSPRSGAVAVELSNGESETLVSDHLIIATGSRPRSLHGLVIDGTRIITSDEALRMEKLPQSIIIIGGGVIGVEWASMLSDFGVEVTVVEYEDRLIPLEDTEVSKELERLFKKRKIKVITSAKVIAESVVTDSEGVTLQAEHKGSTVSMNAEVVLVSVGRQANADNLGLENTDVAVERGCIKVNSFMQTKEPHIYAIGDVSGGLQLAHVAGHEGILAVEHACGEKVHPIENHLISRCIYTRPEIASVGLTEQQAKDKGFELKTGKFTFKAIGKALVYGESDGFVKVIADKNTDDILGVHMIGPHVTDLISEAGLAQVLNATPWEVGQTIHPHPTLSEALGEAMLAVDNRAIGM